MPISRDEVVDLISRISQHLDEEDWSAFLSLCVPDFRYLITVHSPEISREMIWFNQDFAGLQAMFEMVPEHLRRLGTLLRHVSVGRIESEERGDTLVTSTFQCTHTDIQGSSRLLAVGRYIDTVRATGDGLRLAHRNTILASRDLGTGSHIPI